MRFIGSPSWARLTGHGPLHSLPSSSMAMVTFSSVVGRSGLPTTCFGGPLSAAVGGPPSSDNRPA